MLDALCELERAVYTEPDVSPEPSRRAAVDVDAVMEAIKQYQESVEERQRAIYTHRFQYAGALREEQQDRLAAIRALLEPHDAARLRDTIAKAAADSFRGPHGATFTGEADEADRKWYRIADAVIRAIGGER